MNNTEKGTLKNASRQPLAATPESTVQKSSVPEKALFESVTN